MKNFLFRKGVVLGIFILLVGASITITTGSIVKNHFSKDKNVTNTISNNKNLNRDVWWDFDWFYSKKITINHEMIATNFQNFPVLIHNISSDFINHAQTDGYDFVFVSADNTTKYNHEIEYYNSDIGELIAWVNITELSPYTDTVLYLYYGNNICSNQQNIEETWSSDYIMVQHLNEISGVHYDSTSNNHDSTFVHVAAQNAIGQIDGADDFEASNLNYIEIPDSPDWYFMNNPVTISFWVKMESDKSMIFIRQIDGFEFYFNANLNHLSWNYDSQNGIFQPSWNPSLNTWYYLTVTRVGDIHTIFVDGSSIGSTYHTGSFPNGDDVVRFSSIESLYTVDGIMDEIRILNTGSSAENIITIYNNQKYPESFISVGEEHFGWTPIADFYYTPENPMNNTIIQFIDNSTDPHGTIVSWWWDFDDGFYSELQNPTHCYYIAGTYNVSLTVTNDAGFFNTTQEVVVIGENAPPITPTITGPNSGKTGVEYTYCINASDTDNDSLYVLWNWGDGTGSGWLGPFDSGTEVCDSHTWNETGIYTISVTVRDEHGESVTAYKEVIIPRNKASTSSLLQWFLERFPMPERLLGLIRVM